MKRFDKVTLDNMTNQIITKKQLASLASLASLELSPNELDSLQGELESFLSFIDRLQAIDNLNANEGESLEKSFLRKDEVVPFLCPKEILPLSKSHDQDTYLVPNPFSTNPS